ncbi:MAG: hypothetical protein LUO80_05055 [Methylococcaceae bacterium]|nr:hypothetical protein [Methylococcaceae bacterium]
MTEQKHFPLSTSHSPPTALPTPDEKSMRFQEACIPELAEGAVKQAYYQTLAAGCKVIEAINGQLVESSPDGSVRVLRKLPMGIPVSPGQRVVRLKK